MSKRPLYELRYKLTDVDDFHKVFDHTIGFYSENGIKVIKSLIRLKLIQSLDNSDEKPEDVSSEVWLEIGYMLESFCRDFAEDKYFNGIHFVKDFKESLITEYLQKLYEWSIHETTIDKF